MIHTNSQVTAPELTVNGANDDGGSCSGLPEPFETVIREMLARVSTRWSLWTLHKLAAASSPLRFTRLHDAMAGVSQKMLTQTLRHLERDGLVNRIVYAQVPPRVEYEITALGRELLARVDPVVQWARAQAREFAAAQQRFDIAAER